MPPRESKKVRLRRAVFRFLAQAEPLLLFPEQTEAVMGRCYIASYALKVFLWQRGWRCRLVGLQGLKRRLPRGAYASWRTLQGKGEDLWHYVLVVDDCIVVDLTAAQFGHPTFRIEPWSSFRKQWRVVHWRIPATRLEQHIREVARRNRRVPCLRRVA